MTLAHVRSGSVALCTPRSPGTRRTLCAQCTRLHITTHELITSLSHGSCTGFLETPIGLGGGGVGVRNLPQFYRNFSVMPLFKNFIFPLRNILSLPSLLRGTLYVYVFSSVLHVIFVAGRFLFFVFPKCHPLLGTVLPAMVKGQ